MAASDVTIDGTLGEIPPTSGGESESVSSSFEKIKTGAREMGAQAKASAMEMGRKAKAGAVDLGIQAKTGAIKGGATLSGIAQRAAANESLVQTGLMLSLGATVLTSVRGLKMRQYHPYAGAALVGFTLLHVLQKNKRQRIRKAKHEGVVDA